MLVTEVASDTDVDPEVCFCVLGCEGLLGGSTAIVFIGGIGGDGGDGGDV